jgi:hypothetical protein
LSGVGQRKITKNMPYLIIPYTLPWMGKIGGYGDLMARGGGNIFSSKIYGGHWKFMGAIGILWGSLESSTRVLRR